MEKKPEPQPFPRDKFLRDAGFEIFARPDRDTAFWIRDGVIHFESDAWTIATSERFKK